MLAEEGKRNWVLVVAIVLVILFVGGVIASFLSTPAVEPPKAIKAELKDGSVVLTWEPPETAVDGYRVYRGLVGEKPQLIAEIPSSQPPTYADSSVKEGKEYVYYLTSYKGSEESVKSPPVSVYIEPFPPYDVKLEVLDVCAGDGDIVVSFSAKRADGCSFSFNARDWKDYPLDASPITLRPPAQLSEGGEAYLYMKCYRMVDGKRVESDVLRASITSDVLPPQLYGDVKVEEGKAIVKVSSNEELKGCTAFAGPQPLGSFEKEATFALPPGEYLLTISCQDECGNTNFLAYPVENNYQEIEVNNTTYRIGLEINNGAASTTSREVVLNIVSENFKECRFANDEDVALNAWSDWEPARDEWEKPWVLAACDGKRSVYMQCRDGDVSYTVKDSIYCGVVESNDTNATGAVSAYAMGVVDRYIVADNTIQPILAGDLEGQSANFAMGCPSYPCYTGGFFVFSFDRNESEEMQRYYTGGFFVFGMPVKECTTKEPVLRKVSSLSPDVTKTGEVYLSFSQPVDRVEVFMGPNKVAVEKIASALYKIPAPLTSAVEDDAVLTYHWKAYRVVENEEVLVGEGTASILWDRTHPTVSVECEDDKIKVDSKEDLQLIYLTASTGSSEYYCYEEGMASFRLPTTGGVAIKGKAYDKAGYEVDVSTTCSLSSPAFEVYGLVDSCSPQGGDVVCEERYALGLSKGEQGKVVINTNADGGTLEGFFTGFKATACDPRLTSGEFEGTFTAKVADGSSALHTVTYIPCVEGREGEPMEAAVLIDKAPPVINGVTCEEVPSTGGSSYVCTISARDESGIATYKLEVCRSGESLHPIEDEEDIPELTRISWCSGTVESYTSTTSTISVGSTPVVGDVLVTVWDAAGNKASRIVKVGEEVELSIDVKGTVTSHRLEMVPDMEVVGRYVPNVVEVASITTDALTSNPVVLLNPRYRGVEYYTIQAQRVTKYDYDWEALLGTSEWLSAPLPTTYELPAASGKWVITAEGKSASGTTVAAQDEIYLDVTPPTVSLSCSFKGTDESPRVECDYSASDNLASPLPLGIAAPNKGIASVQAYVVARTSDVSFPNYVEETVYGPILLSDAVGTFSIPLAPEEASVSVYVMVEDQAGNYDVEEAYVGRLVPSDLATTLTSVQVEKALGTALLADEVSLSYQPVDAVRNWDNLYVSISAENAAECGYCLSLTGEECKVTNWRPYTGTPTRYPLEALTTSDGIFYVWAQCRGPEGQLSNRLADSFIVDAHPPSVALKVEASISPWDEGSMWEAVFSPPPQTVGGIVALLGGEALLNEPPGCPCSCEPDYYDEMCDFCCGGLPPYTGGGSDGGDTGGGSSSCYYPACSSGEEVSSLTFDGTWYRAEVGKSFVFAPPKYVETAECALKLDRGDEVFYKGSCNAYIYGVTSCCSGSYVLNTQRVNYSAGLFKGYLPGMCSDAGDDLSVYILTSTTFSDGTTETEQYSVGKISCADYVGETPAVDGLNTVKISAEDGLSGVSLVIVYRESGEARVSSTGSYIQPVDAYSVVKTYINPEASVLVFNDYVPYSADVDTAEDGYIFYRYKVVVYDEAGNRAETYTDWVAPYSLPSGSPPT